MFATLTVGRPDGARRRYIELKEFKKRTAETKEPFGKGKTDSRRSWSRLQEIANLSTARPQLRRQTGKLLGGKALHLINNYTTKIISRLEKQLNQYPKISFTTKGTFV